MCQVMKDYEEAAREEERSKIALEMKAKDEALASKDERIAELEAQLATVKNNRIYA